MKCACLVKLAAAALVAGSVAGSAASAATITVNGAVWTDPGLIREDFSGYQVCGQTGDLSTPVGHFSSSGGPGEKGTVCGDASVAQVRQGTPEYIALSGRHGAEYWLDSNDNTAMRFETTSRRVQFLTSDLADVYGYFRLDAGDKSFEITEKQANGGLWLFSVLFDQGEERVIHLTSMRNDGFSVGPVSVAPIPLPGAGLLLLGGIGALVAARRLRRGAA
jgi:hypothetical protein